ncbi:MAG: HD-GYP domain-containing protein [Treponemataceae bacterium]|nr:HD-GYP domain-containing protein [Treponemataceae bacterium]
MKDFTEIKVSKLKIGMCFSAPVFFDDGVNMFLAEKKPVRQFHLDVVKRWKIQKVLTYGRVIDDSDKDTLEETSELHGLEELEELEELDKPEELEELESPESLDEDKSQPILTDSIPILASEYAEAVKNMKVLFTSQKESDSSLRVLVDKTAEMLFRAVKQDFSGFVSYVLNKGSNGDYPAASVNVAVMAGAAAFSMDMSDRQILQVMTAALLHDIYMPYVPAEIINKKGRLTSSEFELLKMHTVRGASYLTDTLLLPKNIVNAVLQHHEYYNGFGYPEGRKGKDIDIAARIISVCDAFEAMVSEKPYRNAVIGYEAVKNILKMSGKQFDPDVVKSVVKSTGVYPAGTFVLMSNISVAKVIESGEDALFLPVVKIVAKGRGDIDTGTVIKLKEQRAVFIVRPLNRDEAMKFA